MDEPILMAFASLSMGFILLYVSIFTLTLPHWSLLYLRIALAPPAMACFWNFGYGSYEPPGAQLFAAGPVIALYGVMRILEHSFVGLWDRVPPHWVMHTGAGPRAVLPLPKTFRGRCAYALDLLTSLRGASWFAELEWSWIPRARHTSVGQLSRYEFIVRNIKSLVPQFLLLDMFDMFNKSQTWDTSSLMPVTLLPIRQQLLFSISVCTGTILAITLPYTIISSTFVLCGSSPQSWPPMFDAPFRASSLREFWSRRWHYMFRRVFERLSMPLMRLPWYVSDRDVWPETWTARVMRASITFTWSALLHLIIMYRLALREYHSRDSTREVHNDGAPSFWDTSILGFFLSQPLGLFVESTLVIPLAEWIFPGENFDRQQAARIEVDSKRRTHNAPSRSSGCRLAPSHPRARWLTRLYTWLFLVWTGRWWANKWVQVGMWDGGEKVVPVSLWRGLLQGQWIV